MYLDCTKIIVSKKDSPPVLPGDKKSCVLYCNWRLDHEEKNENGGPCSSDISTPASRTEGTAWTPAAAGTAEEKSWKTVTNQTLEQNPNSVKQVTSEGPMKVWVNRGRMFRHSCCFGRVNNRGSWRRANTTWPERKNQKRGNRQNLKKNRKLLTI